MLSILTGAVLTAAYGRFLWDSRRLGVNSYMTSLNFDPTRYIHFELQRLHQPDSPAGRPG